VATYDRRGHSRSERLPGQGSIHEDVADLAALIDHVFGGPAHVIGNSFGAAIVLNLAMQRPEMIRSLVAHEPPLLGLLVGNTQVKPTLAAVQERIAAVVQLLEASQFEAGARQFVDTIAFGPGAWDQLPQATRDIFVFNAPTWLDEQTEAGWMTLDLKRLSAFRAPALLSLGGESPPFFSLVMQRIWEALPGARKHVFQQAGHVPHMSHPAEYVRVVKEFVEAAP
jgi:pimeloyl-ACP methyl ester carboxylesterase